MSGPWKTTGPQGDAFRSARRSALGYSLVEVLVVVAIVGLAAMLGFQGLASAFKRQNLASGSNDLRAFAQRVQIETQRRNTVSFLVVHPWAATGTLVELILDTNNNGLPDDAALASYTLHPELALSSTSATEQTFTQWTEGDGTHYLECDFQGRALSGTSTPQQISSPATVLLSHRDMIGGSLTPQVIFTLTINPVWNATLTRTTVTP